MNKRYLNYIAGKWIEARSGKFFKNINPANKQDIIGEFPSSSSDDVEQAVRAAQKALPAWRSMPAPKRGELLLKAANLLVSRKEELARDMTREMGKVLKETRGDVQETIDTAFYMAGEGRRLFGRTTPCELQNKTALAFRVPIGVVGVITPWNFPMAIPSWKMLPALICGNTMVCKPASDTPLSTSNLVKVFEDAGIPPGVVNLVHGNAASVGIPIVQHPDIRLIAFTGSSVAGRNIAGIAGGLLKRVSMELGGKNAMIVMDDADIDLAVDAAIWGGFGTTGQRCTATSRIIVVKAVKKAFMAKFIARTNALKIGDGLNEQIEMGPLINEGQLKTVQEYVAIGKKEGAKLVAGGKPYTKGNCAHGYFHEPTIFDNVTPEMRLFQEEIFGPVVSVINARSLEEAIEMVNDSKYGLSSAIFTSNVRSAWKAVENIETGIVYVNAPTIGAEAHLPFGGMKDTGNGHREGGWTALDIFSEWKTVYFDYSGHLQKAQIDNN
jgi:alpha-ketoglutaric semialdehyde dehydrogenase